MRTIGVALVGFGTVGGGVADLLLRQRETLAARAGAAFDLRYVVVRDPDKPRCVALPPETQVVTEIDPVVADPAVEIGVELVGGVEPAATLIARLLNAGKHVVTANKAVLAERGVELFALAAERERALRFEASVAGGIPILDAVGQGLVANRIRRIAGILNGTSNFILSQMRDRGWSYEQALAEAQRLGFAEADPTLDVDGTDAAQKLALLARLGMQTLVPWASIPREGIDGLDARDIAFAAELGYTIKLLAIAQEEEGELRLHVAPTLVHEDRPMGQVRGEYNAIEVVGDAVGDTFYVGKGAGRYPTASSVVAGLVDLAIGRGQPSFRAQRLWESDPPGPRFAAGAAPRSRCYLRFTIADRPGTLAEIARILGGHGISIASVIQHEVPEDEEGAGVPLVIMTHVADERSVRAAVDEADHLPIVREPTVFLPVAD